MDENDKYFERLHRRESTEEIQILLDRFLLKQLVLKQLKKKTRGLKIFLDHLSKERGTGEYKDLVEYKQTNWEIEWIDPMNVKIVHKKKNDHWTLSIWWEKTERTITPVT